MRYALLLAILLSCGGNGQPAPVQDDPAPRSMADVTLLVRNAVGEVIDGATVEPGGEVSDSEGRAVVRLDASVERVLRIAKPGYATQVVRVSAEDSVVVPTALIERASPVSITDASAGGTAAGADGARVTLPANALGDGAGQPVSGAVDVFLTPVMGTPPPKVGHLDPVNLAPREVGKRQARVFPFTPPFNFTGQPAISLPLAWSEDGLPIGMQFAGRYADEATLFRLAAQLEQARPWIDRKPVVWA